MRPITLIVVHCSDTPDDRDHDAADINNWHTWPKYNESTGLWFYSGKWHKYDDLPTDVKGQSGNGWDGIGYHHVIKRDGTIEAGRPYDVVGAHVQGHNENSIGICLIGRTEYTEEQMIGLEGLVNALKARWRSADVIGHCDLDKRKTCPNFNVLEWWDDCRHRRID